MTATEFILSSLPLLIALIVLIVMVVLVRKSRSFELPGAGAPLSDLLKQWRNRERNRP
jgi:hypothetical protein